MFLCTAEFNNIWPNYYYYFNMTRLFFLRCSLRTLPNLLIRKNWVFSIFLYSSYHACFCLYHIRFPSLFLNCNKLFLFFYFQAKKLKLTILKNYKDTDQHVEKSIWYIKSKWYIYLTEKQQFIPVTSISKTKTVYCLYIVNTAIKCYWWSRMKFIGSYKTIK